MNHATRRQPDLRVQISVRDPDDAFLARLTALAGGSSESSRDD